MTPQPLKNRILAVAGIVASALALSCTAGVWAAPLRPLHLSNPLAPHARVLIVNVAGRVVVTGWTHPALQLTGTMDPRDRLVVRDLKHGLAIRIVRRHPGRSGEKIHGARLFIHIPVASRLTVRTVSAWVLARNLDGPVHLKTVSGSIKLQSISHRIVAKSVSGTVSIDDSARPARILAHTVSGGITIQGVGGRVRAGSVSGSVWVGAQALRRAFLRTVSGPIQFVGRLTPKGRYVLGSVSGNIGFAPAPRPGARFQVVTLSGDIVDAIGPPAHRRSRFGPGEALRFVSGPGGARVRIRTLSGNIGLEKMTKRP
jgi:hypothetical protein